MKKILFLVPAIIAFSSVAFAERMAVVFMEMEKDDSDKAAFEELVSVLIMKPMMDSAYDKTYWLVNEDATKDNLFETLQIAVNETTTVDLYIIAHGGMQYFLGHFDDRINTDDILSLGAFPNMNHLRMVYVGACHGWDLTDEFLEAGAKAAVGCQQTMGNFPFLSVFLNDFINRGKSINESVQDGAKATSKPFSTNGNPDIYLDSAN